MLMKLNINIGTMNRNCKRKLKKQKTENNEKP